MSCLGPLGGGGPHASPGSMGQAGSLGVILHWQLHAHHELARAVDRSFMQQPTRSFCVPLLAGSARRPCAHANSCTRHARRGGALGGLGFSDGSLGGGALRAASAGHHSHSRCSPRTQPPGPAICNSGAPIWPAVSTSAGRLERLTAPLRARAGWRSLPAGMELLDDADWGWWSSTGEGMHATGGRDWLLGSL